MYYNNTPPKPMAPTTSDQERWEHTAMRRRMVTGRWEIDLENELSRHLPSDRRAAWGPADLSSNVLENVTRQLAVLYHAQPTVTHSFFDVSPLMSRDGYITKSGLYPLMQRVQQLTIALRECIVRIDLPKNQGLQYRVVTPDYVYCEAFEDAPDVPRYYQELRLRFNPETGQSEWIADCIDIRTETPVFSLHKINDDGSRGIDVTEVYLGVKAMKGDNYPYKDKEGKAFLPIEVFRAEKTGLMWNAFNAAALAYGSLTSGVLWSFYTHVMKSASWPQKYAIGAMLNGLTQENQNLSSRRSAVSTDPSSILMFSADPDMSGQPMIGQFQTGADPLKLLESVSKYDIRVCTAAGISGDILRQSGDPRSGYAISVSREGQRRISRKFAIVQRLYDEDLLAKSCMLLNRVIGLDYPESGYRIVYAQISLSPEETKAQREDVIQKLNSGLISPVDAIQILNPDLDVDGAKMELLRIRRERAEFV